MLAYVGRIHNLKDLKGTPAAEACAKRGEAGGAGKVVSLYMYTVMHKLHFYRTISGVRLCWELEEPKGPKGISQNKAGDGGWRRRGLVQGVETAHPLEPP